MRTILDLSLARLDERLAPSPILQIDLPVSVANGMENQVENVVIVQPVPPAPTADFFDIYFPGILDPLNFNKPFPEPYGPYIPFRNTIPFQVH